MGRLIIEKCLTFMRKITVEEEWGAMQSFSRKDKNRGEVHL
jgi:hypothetical protein